MRIIYMIFITVLLGVLLFLYIGYAGDVKSFVTPMPSGAGEIWWTTVPEIEQAYERIEYNAKYLNE